MTLMKIALVADIHGNLAALEAVAAALAVEWIDRVVCLGDVASTGPQPHEVLARLRELGWPVVMGNADAELLAPGDALPSASEDDRKIADITRWCADQIDDDDRAHIATFQPTIEASLGGGRRLHCCHGSPRSFNDVIVATTPDEELDEFLTGVEADVIAGGHTHRRMLRAHRGREIVNPGSVGLAYEFHPDGSVRVPPWAEFAILTELRRGCGQRRFPPPALRSGGHRARHARARHAARGVVGRGLALKVHRDLVVETDWDNIARSAAHRPWPPPARPWVITQTWTDLLFAHWPVPPQTLRTLIPAGLELDTFDGQAWVGVIPFEHPAPGAARRPVWHAPRLSRAQRAHLCHGGGQAGCLVLLPRRRQPARRSSWRGRRSTSPISGRAMALRHDGDGIHYTSQRRHPGAPSARLRGRYQPAGPVYPKRAGESGALADRALLPLRRRPCRPALPR